MTIKESIIVSIIGVLFFGSIIYAAPTATAPNGNTPTPINALSQSQSKIGAAPGTSPGESGNGGIFDVVNRALGVNEKTRPQVGITLDVNGRMLIGSLSTTNDGMTVAGDMTDMATTTVSQSTSNSTDGNVTVTSLGGAIAGSASSTSVCLRYNGIDAWKPQLVRCY